MPCCKTAGKRGAESLFKGWFWVKRYNYTYEKGYLMADFEKFMECCSFDFEPKGDKTQVVAIFSQGFLRDYPTEFVESNPELVKALVAHDLYDYMRENDYV